jgi:hypothetical protein
LLLGGWGFSTSINREALYLLAHGGQYDSSSGRGKWQKNLVVWTFGITLLGLQILSEIVTLRQVQNVVWVMVPYIYLPYRFWQLYEGIRFLGSETELLWIRYLLVFELVLWIVNYLLDVSQLPKLFRWEVTEKSQISIN